MSAAAKNVPLGENASAAIPFLSGALNLQITL